MSVEVNQDAVDAAAREMAHRMLYAVNFFLLQHKRRVSVPFNSHGPSRPGEYPHLRTGLGRDGTVADVQSVEDVLAAGLTARIGQLENSFYMTHLARAKGRKGILTTADDLRSEVATILTGKPGGGA
jgi:hypothetical protein